MYCCINFTYMFFDFATNITVLNCVDIYKLKPMHYILSEKQIQ